MAWWTWQRLASKKEHRPNDEVVTGNEEVLF